MLDKVKAQLAPTGVLRVGINMSNFLLVSGKSSDEDPIGVSPDMAKAIANALGVGLRLLEYKGAGDVADGSARDEWDIANIGAEPERAKTIIFSPAYCEIQATYLVPANSTIHSVNDVDQPGVRVAVKKRAAYDLYLTDHLTQATLHRAETLDSSFELFAEKNLEVLAGLRPKLLEQQQLMPGSRILTESFTAVQQAIGCQPNKPEAATFLRQFVADSIDNGLVASLIDKHGVTGKLSVATHPT
ncbi:MAG: transporter substrate-binding domain-containing protein [Gammaproteobacteria bacterium]|nr:transporter substrate-binding domain-containing protein [Gammaproteobacteria bacterium]